MLSFLYEGPISNPNSVFIFSTQLLLRLILWGQIMEESFPIRQEEHTRTIVISSLADYLRQYPQDLIDAKRVLRRFRVSAHEFYQALLLLDGQPRPQSSFGD